jgi:multiple sugar transport system substrate-binding protein
MKRLWLLPSLIVAFVLLLSACTAPAGGTATTTGGESGEAAESSESTEVKDFVTWYQYDQNNEDPKNDEAVGNAYLKASIPKFNEEFKGKLTWVNQPQQWSKMATSLVAAVQAGGDVPDLMHMGSSNLPLFIKNGTVEDVTDWIKAQPWFGDLDAAAVAACTGPDGKIYCIPVAETPGVVFYWKDYFPNGFPKTAEEFLARAEELKKEKVYAITYFGSTAFDGEAWGRYFWSVISSFGGKYDDGNGNLKLNTPENVKAVEFMREVVAKGYSSDSVWLGDFKEENDLKGMDPNAPRAASFPTGIFGYRYIQPVKAPNGKQYGQDFDPTGGPMLEAIAAGDMGVATMFGGNGQPGSCGLGVSGFVIPKGAKNIEGAKTYVNWLFKPENGIEWVQKPGGGFPASKVFLADKTFDTPFYKQASEATEGKCKSPVGSLQRIPEAQKIIATTIFDLIKTNPTADIAAALQKADEEYNRNN